MPDIPQETELKFVLTPEAAARLRSDHLSDAVDDSITSTYYDTPDRELLQAGATLRLRRVESGWLQTLKGAPGGAIARFEDERTAKDGRLDPRLFPRRAYRRLGIARPCDLQPLFETHVTRRTKRVQHDAASIELALDRGDIRAGDRRAPIEELELELKAGALPDLFSAARMFAQIDGVSLSLISKSERGHRLASGELRSAVAFRPPTLVCKASAQEGFQTLFLAALHQLCANAELLRETASPGAVHQARVALRHLKTYLTAFKRLVQDQQTPTIKAALKRLTSVFEDARALDVFQSGSLPPVVRPDPGSAGFAAALLAAQTRAYAAVRFEVQRRAFALDLFDLVEWTVCGPWLQTVRERPRRALTVNHVAQKLLVHRWRRLKRRGRRLEWSDPQARHKFRLETKKMRYLAEAFLGDGRARGFLKRLKALQDALGVLNDIAMASATARLALAGASSEAVFSAGIMVGERQAETPRRLKAAKAAFHRLTQQSPALP